MKLLYDIGIYLADFHLKLIAPFNKKLKLGSDGRSETFQKLEKSVKTSDRTFWFHCASLGEYEQGLPVFKELRQMFPEHKIILSFFSPSGYEIRKNSEIADVVVYLPIDTKSNAKRFVGLVHPELTIFVKYDIWPNYLLELKRTKSRAILISALFRKNQSYFKWYGDLMLKALKSFDQIFVQNETSKTLLNSIGIEKVVISGDTRYDRVSNQLEQDNNLPFIEEFKQNNLCVVIGSSWPADEEILVKFINENNHPNVKYIIAPHNIRSTQIESLQKQIKSKTILFSDKLGKNLSDYNVFIVDTIGILSKVYSYAEIAYVGGAMGTTGLHNILEPAVFGIPIIIGDNYQKFPEADAMIENKGVISVSNFNELKETLNFLIKDNYKRQKMGKNNEQFILKNKGAIVQILNHLRI